MNNYQKNLFPVASHTLPTIALLIDADNLPAYSYDMILKRLESKGNLCIQRVYANWQKDHMNAWARKITDSGLTAIQQFDHLSGKNSSDIALCIDALDLMHSRHIDIFCIASSDGDFSPLCLRLREYGKYVIGMGKHSSSKSLINACNEFQKLRITTTAGKATGNNVPKSRPNNAPNPNKNPYLLSLIHSTLAERGYNGIISLAHLGEVLSNDPQLPVGLYRVSNIDDLIRQIENIEIFEHKGIAFVRDRYADASVIDQDEAPDAILEEDAIVNVISNAIAQQQKAGWAKVSAVDDYVRANFGMDYRQLGYDSMEALVNNFSQFETYRQAGVVYVADARLHEPVKPHRPKGMQTLHRATPRSALQANAGLVNTLLAAINLNKNAEGWARLASVGSFVKQGGIEPQALGYQNLKSLITAVGLYDCRTIAGVDYVRLRAPKATAPAPKRLINREAFHLAVREAVAEHRQTEGWATLADVGNTLRQAGYSAAALGYSSLSNMLQDIDFCEMTSHNTTRFVRIISTDNKAPVAETAAVKVPAMELPADDTLIVDTAVDDTPVDDTPDETAIAEVASKEEFPVDDASDATAALPTAPVLLAETLSDADYDEDALVEIQRLESLINQAIHALAEPHIGPSEYIEDGDDWASQEAIENFIYQDLDISSKDYDCATYPEFLEALNRFQYVQESNISWFKAQAIDPKALKGLIALLREAVKITKQRKGPHRGWAKIGDIGTYARGKGVTSKQYGYTTFKDLLETLEVFEVKKVGRGSWVKIQR